MGDEAETLQNVHSMSLYKTIVNFFFFFFFFFCVFSSACYGNLKFI